MRGTEEERMGAREKEPRRLGKVLVALLKGAPSSTSHVDDASHRISVEEVNQATFIIALSSFIHT